MLTVLGLALLLDGLPQMSAHLKGIEKETVRATAIAIAIAFPGGEIDNTLALDVGWNQPSEILLPGKEIKVYPATFHLKQMSYILML